MYLIQHDSMESNNAEDLGVVLSLNQAHQQLPRRSQLMLAMLRQVETFSSRFVGESVPQALLDAINNISELQDPVYGEIVLVAKNFICTTSFSHVYSSRGSSNTGIIR